MRTANLAELARDRGLVFTCEKLPRDFQRVLRVQFKEFIHWLDEIHEEKRAPVKFSTSPEKVNRTVC